MLETADFIDRLSIHQSTLMQCDFSASVDCLARHGIRKTVVWHEKLDAVGLKMAKSLLSDAGVAARSFCVAGLFTEPDESSFAKALDTNRQRIAEAAELGAASIVMISGGLPEGSKDLSASRARTSTALKVLSEDASAAGVRIALEPLHPMVCGFRSIVSTLDDALAVIEEIDAGPSIGLALDTYAVWWDPNVASAISRAGDRVINYHVSDWLTDTADIRLDRGMPGDGIIDLKSIRCELEAAGFAGDIEIEILSRDNWWQCDPDELLRTILNRAKEYV